MTGIDVLVGMVLMGCVDYQPVAVSDDKTYTATFYECPLIGHEAVFVVIRKVCSKDESYAISFRDMRDGRGFFNDRFGQMQPAYVKVEANAIYTPPCHTDGDTTN
jgi:hypothetical protein